MTVKERLTDSRLNFTRSEIKVARELLSNYPTAGLTTISRLARRARVSAPTVVRLAYKLGFDGFVQLQEMLLAEVEAHLSSPLTMLASRRREGSKGDLLGDYLDGIVFSLQSAGGEVLRPNFDSAASLLADTRKRICCLGGRFSRHLAAILKWHLQQLRPGVELLGDTETDLADRLVDIDARHILVVYDLRRYQSNIVLFSNQAHTRGCKIILFTDKWKSPIAAIADLVFSVPIESVSPFDTMVPVLAVTEALIAAVISHRDGKLGERLEAIEQYRSAYHLTLDGPEPPRQSGDKAAQSAASASGRRLRAGNVVAKSGRRGDARRKD